MAGCVRNISRAEAIVSRFNESDVLVISEIQALPNNRKREVAQIIANEIGQGARICMAQCSKIHFRQKQKCLSCAPLSAKKSDVNYGFSKLSLSGQVSNMFQETNAVKSLVLEDNVKGRQRLIDAEGAMFADSDVGALGHAKNLAMSLLGYPTTPRVKVVTVYKDREPSPNTVTQQGPTHSVTSPTTTLESAFLRPEALHSNPLAYTADTSRGPSFHPLQLLKRDLSSPSFIGQHEKPLHFFIIGGTGIRLALTN